MTHINRIVFAKHLREIANTALDGLRERLPAVLEERFILFMEIQRVFDVQVVQQHFGKSKKVDITYYDILRLGMNLATATLIVRLQVPGAIPVMASTPEFRGAAERLLYAFGLVALARRTADMVEHEFLLAERCGDMITLRDSGAGLVQFMDHVEHDMWRRIEKEWTKGDVSPNGWSIRGLGDDGSLIAPGNFWSRPEPPPERRLTPDELKTLMFPLIRPWVTPYGTMMGYGATPIVDEYFVSEAGLAMLDFKACAGIHSQANFGQFTGAELLVVTTLLLSFFQKHVYFGLLAHANISEISVKESLTIWVPIDDLANTIGDAGNLPRRTVDAVLKSLTITAEDAESIGRESTPLLPMLIDLGNGFVLRPVSSLSRNPLAGFHTIAQWRNSASRNIASSLREAWLREEIYSVFGGRRYLCVDTSIILRKSGRRLTDVDAAIFDRTNGELAFIQIKWQDYATNSIRELRSKARNMSDEVDRWAERVVEWIAVTSPDDVARTLRLRLSGPQRITAIYLFVVSRHVARTKGYGFPVTNPYLSLATWAQFRRVRCQVGPAPQVISRMHEVLREEEGRVLSSAEPIPVTVELPGLKLHFVDLWNKWGDQNEGEGN